MGTGKNFFKNTNFFSRKRMCFFKQTYCILIKYVLCLEPLLFGNFVAEFLYRNSTLKRRSGTGTRIYSEEKILEKGITIHGEVI